VELVAAAEKSDIPQHRVELAAHVAVSVGPVPVPLVAAGIAPTPPCVVNPHTMMPAWPVPVSVRLTATVPAPVTLPVQAWMRPNEPAVIPVPPAVQVIVAVPVFVGFAPNVAGGVLVLRDDHENASPMIAENVPAVGATRGDVAVFHADCHGLPEIMTGGTVTD
jgi:hypothetical protein